MGNVGATPPPRRGVLVPIWALTAIGILVVVLAVALLMRVGHLGNPGQVGLKSIARLQETPQRTDRFQKNPSSDGTLDAWGLTLGRPYAEAVNTLSRKGFSRIAVHQWDSGDIGANEEFDGCLTGEHCARTTLIPDNQSLGLLDGLVLEFRFDSEIPRDVSIREARYLLFRRFGTPSKTWPMEHWTTGRWNVDLASGDGKTNYFILFGDEDRVRRAEKRGVTPLRIPTAPSAIVGLDSTGDGAEGVLKRFCSDRYPTDFEMQEYCRKQQREAVAKLLGQPSPSIPDSVVGMVRNQCAQRYPADFEMREYCEKQQFEAYEALERR